MTIYCAHCGTRIVKLDKPHVREGHVVCPDCHQQLQANPVPIGAGQKDHRFRHAVVMVVLLAGIVADFGGFRLFEARHLIFGLAITFIGAAMTAFGGFSLLVRDWWGGIGG